ncbi:MAG: lactate utilization protein [Veillonellales bacterium]
MSEFTDWHNDLLGAKVVEALKKNNFTASYVKTRKEALEKLLALIPQAATIGIAGSWTIKEIGLDTALEKRGNTVYNHNKPGLTKEESLEVRRKELLSDVFLTGTNAVTLDGQLVNVDGAGNRVAAMTFGPKQVYVIVGTNKIVKDLNEAQQHIKLYAAPINNKRLNLPNPCVKTGECMNCQSPSRICNITTIMHKRPMAIQIHVVVVGEQLGF